MAPTASWWLDGWLAALQFCTCFFKSVILNQLVLCCVVLYGAANICAHHLSYLNYVMREEILTIFVCQLTFVRTT